MLSRKKLKEFQFQKNLKTKLVDTESPDIKKELVEDPSRHCVSYRTPINLIRPEQIDTDLKLFEPMIEIVPENNELKEKRQIYLQDARIIFETMDRLYVSAKSFCIYIS